MKFITLPVVFLLLLSCQKQEYPFQDPSILLEERVDDLTSRLTLEEKLSLLHVTSPAIPRLGIEEYHYGNEALHGIVRRNGRATVFPMAIAMAATWNPELIEEVATAISDEARGKHNESGGMMTGAEEFGGQFNGLLTFFSPTINMARDPRWGRTAETYGEDPWLTSRIALAFIKGMQGNDPKYLKTICTPKHFVANNEEHNRYWGNAEVSEKTLREYYFPAYKASVMEGKAGAIMSAYNAINGIPCTANKWLLSEVLRDDWGFNGYVVCDCGAIKHLYESNHYAKDSLEAAIMALKAGVDLECGGKEDMKENLAIALEKGLITENEIDEAVKNILRGRFLLGMFDPECSVPYDTINPAVVGSPLHVKLALQSARESIVLLKNENNTLPIDRENFKNILVVGPNANVNQFGEPNYTGVPFNPPVNPLEGIREIARKNFKVNHVPWQSPAEAGKYKVLRFGENEREIAFTGQYFDNPDFEGNPRFSRKDLQVNFDWDNEPPDPFITTTGFAVKWQAIVQPEKSGTYGFRVVSNDSVILRVNGQTLITANFDNINGLGQDSIEIELSGNEKHTIEVLYSNSECCDPLVRLEWKPPYDKNYDFFGEAMEQARENDLVIAFLGLDSHTAVERFDRETLDLPWDQQEFIQQIHQVNPNTIVVLINGNPLSVNWVNEHVPAVIEAWFPGEHGGTAIAEVLFGNISPSGRLPLTFYKSTQQLPPFNSYEISKGHTYMYLKEKPLYPFGHGLSYSKFNYRIKSESNVTISSDDTVHIALDLTNSGKWDGSEVVQVYSTYEDNQEKAEPIQKLVSFKKVFLKAGTNETIDIAIPGARLAVFDENLKKFAVRNGNYQLSIGSSSADIRKIVDVEVKPINK